MRKIDAPRGIRNLTEGINGNGTKILIAQFFTGVRAVVTQEQADK